MKAFTATFFRFAATTLVVAITGYFAGCLWNDYTASPWTRDARVQADVVSLAPDVSGLVDSVSVEDNAIVHKGDILFTVDRARFKIARDRADAAVDAA
ncbi:biotin/lipoyl-binding protein [Rhizobium grahamii]|uniref:biotin/lipoyl-binding protein n=1 Tax=Rhizobium grahamii TaxID=1120045 RepID=UPI000E0BF78A|nr:biotin/lipoyl-binding protein [Rhizobium grahamii]